MTEPDLASVSGRDPLGFAIVGCGTIPPAHAQAIAAAGGRLVACFDPRTERAADLAARFGGVARESLDAVLADPAVDVVSVCTPSGLHADTAVPAARAGKHLLVEKPLDVDAERGRSIVAAARAAGVRLSVVSQHRFDDSTVAARRAIESDALGRIVFAQAQVLWYRTQAYYDADPWRGTWRLDGGVLMNQAIHSIDLLRFLAGEVERAEATMACVAHDGIEVEDLAVATLRFGSGAIGAVAATTATCPGFGARIEVYGTRGAVRIEDDRLTFLGDHPVDSAGGPAGAVSDPGLPADSHARQVADLVGAIREGRQPLVDGQEGLRTLELVLAIYDSARTGAEVAVPASSTAEQAAGGDAGGGRPGGDAGGGQATGPRSRSGQGRDAPVTDGAPSSSLRTPRR